MFLCEGVCLRTVLRRRRGVYEVIPMRIVSLICKSICLIARFLHEIVNSFQTLRENVSENLTSNDADVRDVSYILFYLAELTTPEGDLADFQLQELDVNRDTERDISDAIYALRVISFIFRWQSFQK